MVKLYAPWIERRKLGASVAAQFPFTPPYGRLWHNADDCIGQFAYAWNKQQDSFEGGADMTFTRITVSPKQMGGVPCIRGLRIPVSTVVGMIADGMADAEILRSFPDLQLEDIREALRYAAEAVRERELPLAPLL